MFLLIFLSAFLIVPRCKTRRTVDGYNVDNYAENSSVSVSQEIEQPSTYDIALWVQHLYLQQCAFVEIGESFCALFVELRSIPTTVSKIDATGAAEFFLGICDSSTLRSWQLCSGELSERRKSDCTFAEGTAWANTTARVHRRLCDVSLLRQTAPHCNCSITMAGQQLYRTKGFPTCFHNPLPESLCSPRGVCGIAQCTAITIRGIHSPRCAANCHQQQPFCEEIGPWTSIPPDIGSLWSEWSLPRCNNTCGKGFLLATAFCHNQVTGTPAIDCIGPGSFCCPRNLRTCFCEVITSNGIMLVHRFTDPCISNEGCNSAVDTHPLSIDNRYNVLLRDIGGYRKLLRTAQRHLLGHEYYRNVNEKIRGSQTGDRSFFNEWTGQANLNDNARDHEDDEWEEEEEDDDDDEDDDEKGLGDSVDEENETDEEEEEGDERVKARTNRWPRKRGREASSDYVALLELEGKEVVELAKTATSRSVTEVCEDEEITKLPEPSHYYDYDSDENGASSIKLPESRMVGIAKLAIVGFLLSFLC